MPIVAASHRKQWHYHYNKNAHRGFIDENIVHGVAQVAVSAMTASGLLLLDQVD